MDFPGIGKLKKEKTVDPSRAFGAQGQSQQEILGGGYVAPPGPSVASKAGALFSGLRDKATGLASHVHIPGRGYAQAPYPQEGYPQDGYPQDGYPQEGYRQDGYSQDGYPQGGYSQDGYPEAGYDYPPEESAPQGDGWYNPFTDPPAQDPYRRGRGAGYGYAPYERQREPVYAAPPAYAPYPYEQETDYGYGYPPEEPYDDGYDPRDMAPGGYASEEYAPYGEEDPYAPPMEFDPYDSANGYYVGDDPYGNPMYVPYPPSRPAPKMSKPTDIRELKSTLWAVSIVAGAVLTLFSFVYACVI